MKMKKVKEVDRHEGDDDTCYSWSSWYSPEEPGKRLIELVIRRTETTHSTVLLKSSRILRKVLNT